MDGEDDKSILYTWGENEYLYAPPQPIGSHVCKEIPFPHNSESLGC